MRRRIEAGRVAAQQYLRNEGRLYVRVFPHKSDHLDSLGNPHGQGKGRAGVLGGGGAARHGVVRDFGGVSEEAARMCFARLAHKMPVRVRFIKRRTT